MSDFPFRVIQRTEPMHVPAPRSAIPYILIAVALFTIGAAACH